MGSSAEISTEVVCRYAADAARDVPGVAGLVESHLPARGRAVRLLSEGERPRLELHLAVRWGTSIPDVGRGVQERVRAYLQGMVGLELAGVDVVIDEIRDTS